MTVSVRDARGPGADRRWIEGIYREYLEDLAPLNTGVFPVLGEVGHRVPDQLSRWFADTSAHILTIVRTTQPVGFAMVVKGPPPGRRDAIDYRMAEFFISRTHRRLGVGASAVELIFDRFAGQWEVIEYLRNPGAVHFWRRVVSRYTQGKYQERVVNGEVRQSFETGRARAR